MVWCVVLWCVVLFCVVWCGVVWCVWCGVCVMCGVVWCGLVWRGVLCCVVLYCVVLYCVVLCCVVLYCVVLCCIVVWYGGVVVWSMHRRTVMRCHVHYITYIHLLMPAVCYVQNPLWFHKNIVQFPEVQQCVEDDEEDQDLEGTG